MKKLLRFFSKRTLSPLVTSERGAISRAYHRRAKEIESLRQHDLGNKTIDAPDLGKIVRGV